MYLGVMGIKIVSGHVFVCYGYKDSEQSCICVLWVSILPLSHVSTIFNIWFGNCSDAVVFLLFILWRKMKSYGVAYLPNQQQSVVNQLEYPKV